MGMGRYGRFDSVLFRPAGKCNYSGQHQGITVILLVAVNELNAKLKSLFTGFLHSRRDHTWQHFIKKSQRLPSLQA